MDRGVLETADVFFLVAPATMSGEAVEIITRRVQEGARFLAVLDGLTAPSLIPASFNPPFQLLRPVVSAGGESVVPGTRKLFLDVDAGDLSAIRFQRYYQNHVVQGRNGEVLLSYPDGSAAVTFSTVGKGAAVFMNLALTPDGGDFVGNPMFPASIHELLRLLRRSSDAREVTPGTPWIMETATKGEGALAVFDPNGRELGAQVIASGRTSRLVMPPARFPGLYAIRQSGTAIDAKAINVDPRESDTRPIPLENIKATGGVVTVARDEEDLLLSGKSKPLWPQLAAATVAMLALEMILLAAWRRTPRQTSRA
jgi:hypothetical protein